MNVRPLAAIAGLVVLMAAIWGAGAVAPAAPDKPVDKQANEQSEQEAIAVR